MSQKKTVEVHIAQQKLCLRTDQDPKRVLEIADLVNQRLADILPFNQPVSHQVLLLLAMNLAEDLLRAQADTKAWKGEVRQRSQALLLQLEREFPV